MDISGTKKVKTLIELIAQEAVLQGTGNDINLNWFIRTNAELLEEEKQFRLRKFRGILSQEYELERMGPFMRKVRGLEARNRVLIKEKKAINKNNGYLWVTINPQSTVMLNDFIAIIKKICTKTCFTGHKGVFEQRGTVAGNDIGAGLHAHILFKRNLAYKPTKCCTNIRKSCSKIVGNINNNNQVNISIIGPDFAKDKLQYMSVKTGEGKSLKQEGDVIFRTKNGLTGGYADGDLDLSVAKI